jgi:hypothetical protein
LEKHITKVYRSSEELIRMKVENQKRSNVKISINLLGKGYGSLFPFTIRGALQSIPNAKQKDLQTAICFYICCI